MQLLTRNLMIIAHLDGINSNVAERVCQCVNNRSAGISK